MVENDPVNALDYLGLADTRITVSKCEILLYLDHNSRKTNWEINAPPCSGVEVITCFPRSAHDAIPGGAQLPSQPNHDNLMENQVTPHQKARNMVSQMEGDGNPSGRYQPQRETDMERALFNLTKDAAKKARELINKGCCDKVEIKATDTTGYFIPKSTAKKPKSYSFTIHKR